MNLYKPVKKNNSITITTNTLSFFKPKSYTS